MTPEERDAWWQQAMENHQRVLRAVYPNPFGSQANAIPDTPELRAPLPQVIPSAQTTPAQSQQENWIPVEKAQKNDAGEYRAFVNGQWVPALKAQKNESGQYRAVIQAPPPQQSPSALASALSYIGAGAGGNLMGKTPEIANEAGGRATDIASQAGASPEVAAGIGTATNVGINAIPMLAGGGGANVPAASGMAQKLMIKAIDPLYSDLRSGAAQRAAKLMLEKKLSPNISDVEKLREQGTSLNQQVTDILEQSTGKVDRNTVGSYIQDVVNKIDKHEFSQDAVGAVEKVYNQFLDNPKIARFVDGTKAQELKQGIYQKLKDEYGELSAPTVEAMKSVARGYKDQLELLAPEVAPLNKQASEIWNALNVVERRALMNLKSHANALVFLAHRPDLAMAYLANKSTAFKAGVAHLLNQTGITTALGATPGAVNTAIQPNQE